MSKGSGACEGVKPTGLSYQARIMCWCDIIMIKQRESRAGQTKSRKFFSHILFKDITAVWSLPSSTERQCRAVIGLLILCKYNIMNQFTGFIFYS